MNNSGYPADPAGTAATFRQPPAAAYIGGRVARSEQDKHNPAGSKNRQGSKPMPKWLAEKIAANTRRAHEATCTGCGSPVLAGPDGKLAAITAMVDVTPSNQTGELRALIAGLRTYTLIDNELDLRDHFGGVETRPIYIEHTCQEATP